MPSLAKTVLQVLAAGRLTSAATFRNPIFSGFHPDPSLPIYASRDLVYWSHISNALSRPEQLPQLAFLARGATSGVYAPALRHRDGHFYILTTLADQALPGQNYTRWDNFAAGPSSRPSRGPWRGTSLCPRSLLPPHLFHWRLPVAKHYAVSPPERPGTLRLGSSRLNLTGSDGDSTRGWGQTFVARKQAHTRFRFSIDMEFGENGGRKTMMTREDQEVGVTALQDQSLPVGTSGFRLRR
ncbi:beta-xylosidase [Apiospora saccharicola]|uniref:Beta-xylosidase n=1 Tax=Apiospora saccharicola TaxID=335842 RepID=A0ABR1U799_9PEZI